MSSGIYRLSRLWGRRNQLVPDVGGYVWSGAAQVLQVPRGKVEEGGGTSHFPGGTATACRSSGTSEGTGSQAEADLKKAPRLRQASMPHGFRTNQADPSTPQTHQVFSSLKALATLADCVETGRQEAGRGWGRAGGLSLSAFSCLLNLEPGGSAICLKHYTEIPLFI